MRWFHMRDLGVCRGDKGSQDGELYLHWFQCTNNSIRNTRNDTNQDVLMIYHDVSMISRWKSWAAAQRKQNVLFSRAVQKIVVQKSRAIKCPWGLMSMAEQKKELGNSWRSSRTLQVGIFCTSVRVTKIVKNVPIHYWAQHFTHKTKGSWYLNFEQLLICLGGFQLLKGIISFWQVNIMAKNWTLRLNNSQNIPKSFGWWAFSVVVKLLEV